MADRVLPLFRISRKNFREEIWNRTMNMEKVKKVANIVGNTLIWLFVILSLVITVMVFTAQASSDDIPALFGKSLLTIQTSSMEKTYNAGDMVFMTKLSDEEKMDLKAGDIITYHAPIDINGDGMIGDINTHRIVSHDPATGVIITKGDNNHFQDNEGSNPYTIHRNDVIGLCTDDGKLSGLGGVIDFLRSRLGFFVCIILPLILFFIFELYNFISILVSEKAKKAPVAKETEEEIKRRAIEEYIKSQQQQAVQENAPTDTNSETPEEEPSSEDKE